MQCGEAFVCDVFAGFHFFCKETCAVAVQLEDAYNKVAEVLDCSTCELQRVKTMLTCIVSTYATLVSSKYHIYIFLLLQTGCLKMKKAPLRVMTW